jgi:hypothetical protein
MVGASLVLSSCTIRYSQSLTGAIPKSAGTDVRSRDTGFSLLNITFSEPTAAHEQVKSLMGACARMTRVQVDYRELSFLLFGIPSVTVTGVCES